MQSQTDISGATDGSRSEFRSDVEQIGSAVSNRLHSEIDTRKDGAADQARSVSSAMDRAANELDDGAPEWVQSIFQEGAKKVRRLADTLEQRDSREILQDLRTLARDNPGTFLASCAAVGFAAARVFKAGAEDSSSGQTSRVQSPPVQGQEPMFRGRSAAAPQTPTSAGEFA